MAKTRKRKPSFDLPADTPAPGGTAIETGWVYRSDGAPPAPGPPKLEPSPEGGHDIRALAAMPADVGRAPVVERVLDWMAVPFEIGVMMALVPFRSKTQHGQ
jgi:hypothetical protein